MALHCAGFETRMRTQRSATSRGESLFCCDVSDPPPPPTLLLEDPVLLLCAPPRGSQDPPPAPPRCASSTRSPQGGPGATPPMAAGMDHHQCCAMVVRECAMVVHQSEPDERAPTPAGYFKCGQPVVARGQSRRDAAWPERNATLHLLAIQQRAVAGKQRRHLPSSEQYYRSASARITGMDSTGQRGSSA